MISESDLHTILDNLSRKYSIKVITEYLEERMPSAIGYSPRRKAIMVNIPKFLNIISDKKDYLKFYIEYEDDIEAKFLHECHHSKINPICRKTAISADSRALLNVCEDYYINNILMKDNDALMTENLIFREVFSKRVKENKINIEFKDLYTIFILCSIYDKDELKDIYDESIIEYKKIFESIKSEDDICKALTELSSYGNFTLFPII